MYNPNGCLSTEEYVCVDAVFRSDIISRSSHETTFTVETLTYDLDHS